MIRQLARHSLLYAAAGIITQGMSFALLPLYTQALSPREYGTLDVLLVVGSLAAVSVALEIGQGLARHVPDQRSDPQAIRLLASTAMWFTLGCHGLFFAAILLARPAVATWLLGDPGRADEVEAAAWCWLSTAACSMFMNQFRWELRASTYLACSLALSLAMLAGSVLLVVILDAGVSGALWARTLANLLVLGAGLCLLPHAFRLAWDAGWLRRMLAFSLPLVPSSLGVILALYLDRLCIQHLLGLEHVGLYGLAARIAGIAALLTMGLQSALTPLIYANHAAPETPSQLRDLLRWYVGGALVLFLTLAGFGGLLLDAMTPDAYAGAYAAVPALTLAVLAAQLYLFAPGLSIAKRSWTIAMINLSAAVANVGLNMLLIPLLGIQGAALATLIATLGSFAAQHVLGQRSYPVCYPWGRIVAATSACLAVAAGGIAWQADTGPGPLLGCAMAGAGVGVVWGCGLVATRDIARLRTALRQRQP